MSSSQQNTNIYSSVHDSGHEHPTTALTHYLLTDSKGISP